MPTRLRGLIAAPHTPFGEDGSLRLAGVRAQAAHLAGSGVGGVFVAGSTGEGLSLSADEREALATEWARRVGEHGLRLVVHTGCEDLPTARRLASHAAGIGADAIAILPPRYFKPGSLEDLVDWCARIAAAAPALPFYYYDIPVLTGVSFSMSAFLTAAGERIPTLAGLKYTNTDTVEFQRCLHLAGGRYDVLWGTDEAMLAGLALGAQGFVGSTYNFAAPLYHRLRAAFESGDMQAARREQLRSVELIVTLAGYGFLPAAKATMQFLGVDCGPARPPFESLGESRKAALRADLEALGFFDWIADHAIERA